MVREVRVLPNDPEIAEEAVTPLAQDESLDPTIRLGPGAKPVRVLPVGQGLSG
jgi:hypothetical protein